MSLPPVLSLLSEHVSPGILRDAQLLRRALADKGFLRAVRDQAAYSVNEFGYPDSSRAPAAGYSAFLATAPLNPFMSDYKCNDFACRMRTARAAAKLAALYTDYLAVPDEFAALLTGDGPLSASRRRELAMALHAYYELEPLVRAGVIRFTTPTGWTCAKCAIEAKPSIGNIAHALWPTFLRDGIARVVEGPDGFTLEYLTALHDGLWSTHLLTTAEAAVLRRRIPRGDDRIPTNAMGEIHEHICEDFAAEIQNALEHAALAGQRHLAVATPSLIEAVGLRQADTDGPATRLDSGWRARQSIELPWIDDLAPAQLLELRDRACDALPQFRERVALGLTSGSGGGVLTHEELEAIAVGLRLEAEQVRAELGSISLKSARFTAGVSAAATIGLTVVGVGSSSPGAFAMGAGLLGLMAALHSTAASKESDHAIVLSKPGHVLLTAQAILGHAEQSGRE